MIEIIVPTYNRHEAIDRLINDLSFQEDLNFRLNIIDQSKIPYKNKFETNFEVIVNWIPAIRSPILARHYGFQKSKGDVFLFLDDDMIPDKNLVKNVNSIFNEYLEPLVLGGISNVRPQNKFEELLRFIFQRGIYDDPRYDYFKKSYEKKYYKVPSFLLTPYISASILAINRKALEKNPFPINFKNHILGGDIYYGMSCLKKNIRVCISYLLRAQEIENKNFKFKSIKGYKKIMLSFHSALLVLKINGINLKNIFHFFLRILLICLFLIRLLVLQLI